MLIELFGNVRSWWWRDADAGGSGGSGDAGDSVVGRFYGKAHKPTVAYLLNSYVAAFINLFLLLWRRFCAVCGCECALV